jgi:putative PIN family toxin of toxin-antitoxin system
MQVRIVLDTNVVISGTLWHGLPHELLTVAITGNTALYSCPELLSELGTTLARPKFARKLTAAGLAADEILAAYTDIIMVVQAAALAEPVSRHPADDIVLACAVAAGADAITSGDSDLLLLKTYQGIPILSVRQTLQLIAGAPP